MNDTRTVYNDRLNEIEIYLTSLKELIAANEEIKMNPETSIDNKIYYEDEFLKVLKANAILMIYNFVEATVSEGIQEIYSKLWRKALTYQQVSKEIKSIWFKYKFGKYDDSSNVNTFKSKATEILNHVIKNELIKLDLSIAKISGNLDAQEIRNLCKKHGIELNINSTCRGGYVLKDVKDNRNWLAHGEISFTECGRQYTISQLEGIKDDTKMYLDDLIVCMKQYCDDEKFILQEVQ